MSSLDSALDDPTTVDELAEALARTVEIDADTAGSIILALEGATASNDHHS